MRQPQLIEKDRVPDGARHALPASRRTPRLRLVDEAEAVRNSPVVRALVDASDTPMLVLNQAREILAANRAAEAMGNLSDALGLRPGEALGCANARAPDGCGSTPACEFCGALGAILACRAGGRPTEAECRLWSERQGGSAVELAVRASPLCIDGVELTVLSLRDVSSEKRRAVLEQVFLHDALNTLAGLRGWVEILRHSAGGGRAVERVDLLARQLEREIQGHRALVSAEDGTLVPRLGSVRPRDVLRELGVAFSGHPAAEGRVLDAGEGPEVTVRTDGALLLRILVNMTRNALEATPQGGRVRAWAEEAGEGVAFHVHNQGAMPPEVQARVFQRSFSTKAARGRGLGTHGMRLLGERYLGGRVSFRSTAEEGTTFSLSLPRGAAVAAPAGGDLPGDA